MRKSLRIASILTIVLFSSFTNVLFNYTIDSNYSVKFDGGKVAGTFSNLTGTIYFQENNLAQSKIEVEVDVATIKTGSDKMDEHAKKDTWFDAEKFPKIKYKSLSFTKTPEGYSVLGNLTMHGVTKAVSIPFTFKKSNTGGLFEGKFKVNRQDYGIKGNSFGFLVKDLYEVTLKVPVVNN